MVSSEEFYELPREKQQDLVNERQVILSQDPVTEPPDYGAPIRVLDKPLTAAIFERLQTGRYTISELADEIGVRDQHVRGVINQHRHRQFEKVLDEYSSVLRAKDTRGLALVYSLESVPYFARVVDPTLGCSLLGWNEALVTRFDSTGWIPGGKITEIDEEYTWVVTNYWELDPDDTFDYLTDFTRRYVDTVLGPLPIVQDEDAYERVRTRLADDEDAYARRKGIDESTPREKIDSAAVQHSSGGESLIFYQSLSLTLFDLVEYANHENPTLRSAVENEIDVILEWLSPVQNATTESSSPNASEFDGAEATESTQSEQPGTTEGEDEQPGITESDDFDWEERDLLIELVALTQELGRLPSETDVNDRTRFSHRAYIEKFGSLMDAFRQAGILSDEESSADTHSG